MPVIEEDFELADAIVAGALLGAGWALWEHAMCASPATPVVHQQISIVQNAYQLAIFTQRPREASSSARAEAASTRKRRLRRRRIVRLPNRPLVD